MFNSDKDMESQAHQDNLRYIITKLENENKELKKRIEELEAIAKSNSDWDEWKNKYFTAEE